MSFAIACGTDTVRRHSVFRVVHFAATALALSPEYLDAQRPLGSGAKEVVLQTATDLTFVMPFERIRDIRELSDGRVLLAEGGGLSNRALIVLSVDGKSQRQLGRLGDGPNEYRGPSRLFAIGVDRTLVADGTNRRWYELQGDKFAEANDSPVARRLSGTAYLFSGADAKGNLIEMIGVKSRADFPQKLPVTPTLPLFNEDIKVRVHRTTGTIETITTLKGQYFGMKDKRAVINNTPEWFVNVINPLQTYEQATTFADGSLAVARYAPYRVDVRRIDGRWVQGPPVPFFPVTVTNAVKQLAASGHQRNDDGTPVFVVSDFPPWPATVPPFLREAVVAGSDDRLYIKRAALDILDPQYLDVFDRSGTRLYTVALPRGARFLTATPRGLYVVRTTEDGEEFLTRLRVLHSAKQTP